MLNLSNFIHIIEKAVFVFCSIMIKKLVPLLLVSFIFAKISSEEKKLVEEGYRILRDDLEKQNENTENKLETLSFYNALAFVYENNLELKAYRANFEKAVEMGPQAFARYLPNVALNASKTFNDSNEQPFNISYSLDISATINIFESFASVYSNKAADYLVKSALFDFYNKEAQTFINAAQTYLDVIKADSIVALNKANATAMERNLKLAEFRHKSGEITTTDYSQSKAQYSIALHDLQASQQALKQSKLQFEVVFGIPFNHRLKLPVTQGLIEFNSLADFQKETENNFNLQSLYNTMLAKEANITVVKSALLPRVDGVLSHQRQKMNFMSSDESKFNDSSATITANIPLYSAGSARSQLREAKKDLEFSKLTYQNNKKNTYILAEYYWEQQKTSLLQIASLIDQVKANKMSVKSVRQEHIAGTRLLIDVLNEQTQLLNSETDLINAFYDYLINKYNMIYLTGHLNPKELQLEKIYSPETYIDKIQYRLIRTSTPDAMIENK